MTSPPRIPNSVWTNESFPDRWQAYAAGYVEAALTHNRIYEYAINTEGNTSGWSAKLSAFVATNNEWMSEQIAAHPLPPAGSNERASPEAAWWHQVSLMLRQFDGLRDGYRATCGPAHTLSEATLLTLSLHSDMETLCKLLGCEAVPGQNRPRVSGRGHCSVVVKLVGAENAATEPPELYIAHTTWTAYEDMTRVYKMYDFAFNEAGGRTAIAFSGYPGNLYSDDDWCALNTPESFISF